MMASSHTGSLKEGIRLYKIKKWEAALAEFLSIECTEHDEELNIDVAYYLGLCYTKLERYDDALLYLEQVVTADPDPLRTCQGRLVLSYIYSLTNRSRMAEFELKKLLESGFESVQIYTGLGFAAWHQKRSESAVRYYSKALELDTDNTTALNCLGYILCDSELDTIKGLTLCKKAVDTKPDNPAYLDSMGWAFYKNGEILQARTWLRRALDLAPSNKEIREHMSIVTGESIR